MRRLKPKLYKTNRVKPYVFIASSSIIQVLRVVKELKRNGYLCLSLNEGEDLNEVIYNIGENLIDVHMCDAFVFFNQTEMMLWQGVMLGAALMLGKKVYCVSDSTQFTKEPVLELPQIEHFETWDELMVRKFPMKEKFLLRKINGLESVINKLLKGKRKSPYRVKRIRKILELIRILKIEHKERFSKV